MRITLIEARELLGTFDVHLREYAAGKLMRQGVDLRRGVVKRVEAKQIVLQARGGGGGRARGARWRRRLVRRRGRSSILSRTRCASLRWFSLST